MSISVKTKRAYLMTTIVAIIAIAGMSIVLLYHVALDETRARLVETVQSQARLIGAVARYNQAHATSDDSVFEATITPVRDAYKHFVWFGKSGEFVLARQDGDDVIFLLNHRHNDLNPIKLSSLDNSYAEPMRRALQGQSGTVMALDYRGMSVLAAFEPVPELSLGIVAKMDMAEVRAPYMKAGLIVVLLSIGLIFIAARLFNTVTRTLIQSVAESEGRFRTLVEHAADAFFLHDLDGHIIDVNRRACESLGYARDELLKLSIPDIDIQFPQEKFRMLMEKARAGDLQSVEGLHKRKDGSTFPVEVSTSCIVLDGEKRMFAMARDITARKQADALVYKLSRAMEQAGTSLLITDREGTIEYVNPAFTRITGFSAEEAIGQTPRLLKSGNQDATFYESMWNTLSAGDIWNGKVIDKRKDGRLIPVMLNIAPIINDDGLITHFVGSHSDISELENMEHQFYQAQKMEAIGTLVGGIAHDFNNILAGLTGNLYLAKAGAKELPDLFQKLTTIEELSFRAADLIKQLLTFARKGTVSMKPLPLAAFVKEVIKFIRATVPENIDMQMDICSDSLTVRGDATQLQQVVMNLINNACDAVEGSGQPRMMIRLEPFATDAAFMADHAYFKPGRYAHLLVEDNGSGIPEYLLEHLFEPFFTTKEPGKGTGLGLAMVFGAIKTHQGFIEVESSAGKGALFHVYLPLLDAGSESALTLQKRETVKGHGETILLVDDEPHVLEIGKEVLQTLGYQVLEATNGLEAIDMFTANQEQISLIITDLVMPILGGEKAVARIREIRPEMKVIFVSGYDMA